MNRHISIGIVTFLIAAGIHFNARELTWPKNASWGTQVEATSFYSKQKQLENITLVVMYSGVGLFLIGALRIKTKRKQKEERKLTFEEWIAKNPKYESYAKVDQISAFTKYEDA